MISESQIIEKLNSLFSGDEWIIHRKYLRKIKDHQSFINANIIATLDNCNINNRELLSNISKAKNKLRDYQIDHLTFHWPFKDDLSKISNAPLLSRLNFLSISPDADCTSLNQIVLQDKHYTSKIIEELDYYRVDNRRIRLPRFQSGLPTTEGTFLTWFPTKTEFKKPNFETIDIAVDSNILWFLGKFNLLNVSGSEETIRFIKDILRRDLIITDSFRLSQYYPNPIIILYIISRAIHWGNIKKLFSQRDNILRLSKRLKPSTPFDSLLLSSIGLYWDDYNLIEINIDGLKKSVRQTAPFYIAPLLSWLGTRIYPFFSIAKLEFTHMKFESLALQLAILLWFVQNHQKSRT